MSHNPGTIHWSNEPHSASLEVESTIGGLIQTVDGEPLPDSVAQWLRENMADLDVEPCEIVFRWLSSGYDDPGSLRDPGRSPEFEDRRELQSVEAERVRLPDGLAQMLWEAFEEDLE